MGAEIKLQRTLKALSDIIESSYPANPMLERRHEEKVEKAWRYRRELEFIVKNLPDNTTVVAKNTFAKILRSDFVEIDEMGFIRLAGVINYPETEYKYYLWLTPISDL